MPHPTDATPSGASAGGTTEVGRYVGEHQIGRGGMATVWRARDTVLDRPVALKRLRPALLDDAEIATRFRREAEAVAGMSHPGIVRMLDRGEDAEGPFLVMELVEGEDLKARIARTGPLHPDDARRICAQVARALAYAHDRGIVHRDIKSQNVLVDADGNAKLTDFGIAQLAEGHGEQGLTRTGMMVGSSDYLAPEQAEGRPVDGRTDVYALGIVLWECLTGKLPFPGDSFVSVAMRHVTDPLPDPRAVAAGVPAQLAACAMRAAAKHPDQRFQGAASFAHALEEPGGGDTANLMPVEDPWHRDEPDTDRVPMRSRRRSRRSLLVLAAVIVAAALGAGATLAWKVLHDGSEPPPSPAAVALQFIPRDYDPQGTGGEQHDLVPYVADGNPDTAWTTEKYKGSAAFGGIEKTGVGLTLSAGAAYRPTRLDITGSTPGVPVEIRREGELTGPPLAVATLDGRLQHIDLPADTPATIVVWITGLVPVDTASGEYWAGIKEVKLYGVPNTDG